MTATDVPMPREYHMHRRKKYNMHRRDERHALVFSALVILSVLIVAPLLIARVFYVFHAKPLQIEENTINTASVDKVWDLITGDASVGMGGYSDINLWSGFVIMLLRIVQSAVRGIKSINKSMYPLFGCSCFDRSAPPEGLRKYAIVKFNAWAYSGSDHIWASLIRLLWDEVERRFGRVHVGLHRAKIHLAGESPFLSPEDLSKSGKQEKREAAWIKYKIRVFAYAVLSIAAIAVCVFIIPRIAQSIDGNNMDNSNTDNTVVIVTWLCASLGSSPLLLQVVIFFIKIFPYLRQSTGKRLSYRVSAIASSKRKDFSAKEGFMGEVKREVEYLFDLLTTEKYMDKKSGCKRSLRLCVFVDDLDRCPKDMVVKVLEAVILLLVDGPITCWLAIDNRIVVECIKAHKGIVYTSAEIHGHEYLDKIVQLPFCLPDLNTQLKMTYLSKMINELKPSRVSSQIFSNMHAEKTIEELDHDMLKLYTFSYEESSSRNNRMRGSWRGDFSDSKTKALNKEKAISSLLSHYYAMKKVGHEINRQDCHIFGMSVSDLVAMIETSIDNSSLSSVSEQHIENFCLLMKTEHHKWRTHAAKILSTEAKILDLKA